MPPCCDCPSPNPNCPYVVLGQQSPQRLSNLKPVYLELCRKLHPDTLPRQGGEQFIRIRQAWDSLKSPTFTFSTTCPFQSTLLYPRHHHPTKHHHQAQQRQQQQEWEQYFYASNSQQTRRQTLLTNRTLVWIILSAACASAAFQVYRAKQVVARVEKHLGEQSKRNEALWLQARQAASRNFNLEQEGKRLEKHAKLVRSRLSSTGAEKEAGKEEERKTCSE